MGYKFHYSNICWILYMGYCVGNTLLYMQSHTYKTGNVILY